MVGAMEQEWQMVEITNNQRRRASMTLARLVEADDTVVADKPAVLADLLMMLGLKKPA